MIKKILTASGVPFRRSHYFKPPAGTYAVYFDDVEIIGADHVLPTTTAGLPRAYRHDGSIELYALALDPVAEAAVESAILAEGLTFHKEDAYWLQDVQRFQTVYTLSFTSKI
jgi:hypothetical protein